jgi:GNAT superfamily N-acetyltransferase
MASVVRPATPADVAQMHNMIIELAEFEKAVHEVSATEADLHEALFGGTSLFAHVIDSPDGDGLAGMAIWFLNYSTWDGKHGIYLEDLFVREKFRGQGFGTALMKELARIAVEKGYTRFQWWVLNWNQPAIDVYKKLGAAPMDEWTVYRLTGDSLTELGR